MILTPNLQTTLFKQSTLKINHVYIFHYLFKSVGGTTKYENPGENTAVGTIVMIGIAVTNITIMIVTKYFHSVSVVKIFTTVTIVTTVTLVTAVTVVTIVKKYSLLSQ